MRTPGSSLKGTALFKAISILEELENLSQAEEMEEAVGKGVEASQPVRLFFARLCGSQSLAAKVVSGSDSRASLGK